MVKIVHRLSSDAPFDPESTQLLIVSNEGCGRGGVGVGGFDLGQ